MSDRFATRDLALAGPKLAAMSMMVCVAAGLVAPVYAGGASGIGTLLGPAGGCIWGFVLGAALVGHLAQRLSRPAWPRWRFARS